MANVYRPRTFAHMRFMPNRCKAGFSTDDGNYRQCSRKPWKDGWCKQHYSETTELTEAKVEIKRLRERYHEARVEWGRLAVKCDELMAELTSYTESVNADAEVGALVRGMPERTALRRFVDGTFGVAGHTDENAWRALGWQATHDPAEALRHIQQREVGDA